MYSRTMVLGAIASSQVSAVLLPTPPMGFNNWARFECNLDEALFTETANAMVDKGFLAAGYNRINLDDCWMSTNREANGSLAWNSTKFPNGLPWLGQYFHDRGFHFGIYEDAGTLTCGGFPGSLGYEEIDAQTFADWGIDYLKLDGCNIDPEQGLTREEEFKKLYGHWHQIISNMANPLIFSESAPAYFSYSPDNLTDWYRSMSWVPSYGDLARHSYDIAVYGQGGSWNSILTNYLYNNRLARYQKPGFFNDPDFLIPDWLDLSIDEKRSQFALWSSLSAPLIISANISNLTTEEVEYLTNRDIIAVDQDPLAQQATLVSQDGTWDVLTKSLANGDRLLTILNRGSTTADLTVSLARVGLSSAKNTRYIVKDLWTGRTTIARGQIEARNVPSHGTAVFRISFDKSTTRVIPTGMIFTTDFQCLDGASALSVANCTGLDSQVWQTRQDGTIRNLANTSKCLTSTPQGTNIAKCVDGNVSQRWTYHVSGNLASVGTEDCLTFAGESVNLSPCEDFALSQIFALPIGVTIVD